MLEKHETRYCRPAKTKEIPDTKRPSIRVYLEGDPMELGIVGTEGQEEPHYLIQSIGLQKAKLPSFEP